MEREREEDEPGMTPLPFETLLALGLQKGGNQRVKAADCAVPVPPERLVHNSSEKKVLGMTGKEIRKANKRNRRIAREAMR